MSLHKFAEQVASQGRGDDSLLVHMTPDEVQRLQQFAQANGTTLTINPTTGLPEAGMLSDLFKAIAPIALGAFLGPAGMGLTFGGLSSAMSAGIATGGITALATGSLSRGLMAGLGAYGGAGLGEGLMGAATTGDAFQAAQSNLGPEANAMSVRDVAATANINPVTSGFQALGTQQGRTAALNAMGGTKGALTSAAMAAAPIMAMQPTTKMPEPKDTGYIRQFDYNINPDTGKPDPLYGMRAMTPVKASEFGNKTFQGQRDLFRQQNPNPYELGVGSLNQPPQQQQQPTPMASGGIVALADGGVPGYATGSLVGDADILNYFKTPGLSDAQIAADMQKYQVSAADIARATGTQNQQADYEKRFVNTLLTPTTDASEFLKATGAVGLKDQSLSTAMQNAGLSLGAQYALTHAVDDKGYTNGLVDASTGKPIDFYNQIGYTAGALPGDQGGLEGLYGNINYAATGLQNLINSGKMTVPDAQNAALAELARANLSIKDVKAATGKDFGSLFTPKTKIDDKTTVTGGTGNDVITGTSVTPTGFYGNDTGNVLTRTPGDITTNRDGTVTVQPNIPGRPTGGFPGMASVRDTYTAGGGSLGYTSPVVKTAAEHNTMYNKLTDDSLDAYNFLMGKGKNLTQRKAETRNRPVSQRYDEAVLGRKIPKLTKPGTTTDGSTVKGTPGQPQTYFDEAAYLAANPDVAEEIRTGKSVSGEPTRFTSGYEHYLMYGKAGGRKFTGDYAGYTTAAALANAARESGGDGGPSAPGPSGNDSAAPDGGGNSGDGSGGGSPDGGGNSGNGARGGRVVGYALGGLGSLGSYSDGGRLLKGPGDGVSDSIPATIGRKNQPARLADGEFVIPARIVSELGNGSTDAGAKKLYAMMDRVQRARGKTTGKNKVAANSRSDKYLPA